jgi:uncharacterized protein (TIGR02302 family)
MTNLQDSIASRPGWKTERHERFIALARLVLAWERIWPALWPATGVLGLYIAAAFLGITDALPGVLRSLVFVAVLIATGYLLYRELRDWRMPRWEEAARRVERDSALPHRPITERNDRLAVGAGDPFAESLWGAHVVNLLKRLGRLKLAPPAPGLAAKDPWALRYIVLLIICAAFLFAGTDWQRRLALAFSLDEGGAAPVASLDAWITPPAYTGWPPIYLRPGSNNLVVVPAGSQFVLRVHGGRITPHLQFYPEPAGGIADFTGQSGAWGTIVKITADARASISDAGQRLGGWRIQAIADRPPIIAFAAPPTRTERDALKIAYTAGDDYGVASARAVIRPLARNNHASLSVDLPLPGQSAQTVSDTLYRDLTAHPFAGLDVQITLEARDAIGQIGRSKPMYMRLPERVFTNPLARALIEQRQLLALDGLKGRAHVAEILDALTIAPQHFYTNQSNIYLGLRTTYWTLRNARDVHDIAQVQDMLWQIATALEQGGLLDAAAQLRAIQQMLGQALAQGAPQSVIDQLLQRYQQALQNYLRALAQNGKQTGGQIPKNAKVITPSDIEAMLKAIQQLAQTGARQKAQELLSMLQSLLENMHPGGAGSGQADKAMSQAIQGLGDIIGRQRQLLDKSLRQGEGAGDPKEGGGKGLANQQGKLHEDLDRLLKGLHGRKLSGADKFGQAGQAMGDAHDALGRQDFGSASDAQKNALEALKQAAGQLAQQMMQQNGQGQTGQAQQAQDPLGRSTGENGGVGSDTKLPAASALQRARQILEELRHRAAQPGRSRQELDYIDRLLREFR